MHIKLAQSQPFRSCTQATATMSIALILGVGLSACDNSEQFTGNEMAAQDRVDIAKEKTSDAWITTKVKSALLEDSLSKGFKIEVSTVNGVVFLDGQVKDTDTLMHVKEVAEGIKGVIEVNATGLLVE